MIRSSSLSHFVCQTKYTSAWKALIVLFRTSRIQLICKCNGAQSQYSPSLGVYKFYLFTSTFGGVGVLGPDEVCKMQNNLLPELPQPFFKSCFCNCWISSSFQVWIEVLESQNGNEKLEKEDEKYNWIFFSSRFSISLVVLLTFLVRILLFRLNFSGQLA